MIVLVFAPRNEQEVKTMLEEAGIPHYEIHDFFQIEEFKTLEEVESWWEDK